jgi:hypothetical protein
MAMRLSAPVILSVACLQSMGARPALAEQYLIPAVPPNTVQTVNAAPENILPTYLLPSAPTESGAPSVVPTSQPQAGEQAVKPPAASVAKAEIGALQACEWIVKNDPLVSRLDGLNKPDWTAEPLQVFIGNKGNGFADKDGGRPQLPPNQQQDLLDEYHCSHILIKKFVRPQRTATIYVFSFPETDQAYGAYTTMRSGSSTVVVRGDASSEDDDSISFLAGRRLVLLRTTADQDQVSKDQISSLADDLVKAIDDRARKPELIASLPVLDRIAGSERMFMGPLATRKYISLPFMQSLALGKCYAAALAEYVFATPLTERMKVLVIEYANPPLARNLFATYIEAMDVSHKCRALQPTVQLCRNGDTWMLVTLSGSRLTFITGARHKEAPVILQRQFSY